MNKCYRIIWSRALGLWVVVSELASKQGRPARRRDRRRHIVPMLASLSLALLAPPLFAAQASGVSVPVPALKLATQVAKTTLASTTGLSTVAPTLAATAPLDNLPTGGHVVAGNGTISQSGNTLEVDQTSQKLITDWTRFDIGSGYEVDFVQPDTHAVALNRVTGNDPSRIFGTLHSNGQVFLVNANGVLFAQGASVDVGGLVASTLDIANADFLAGNYRFGGNGSSGVIENHGSLRAADGGYIALLGGTVSNSGIVQAQLGSVALAAGNKVSLDFAGDGLLSVSIDQGVLEALVENHGAVIADGGKVLLSAKAAAGLLGGVVNNDGLVQARTLQQHDGQIELLGDMDVGTVNVAGTLDASAPDGGNGGAIETSAAQVHVADGAKITTLAANGHNGGWLIDPQDFTIAASGGDMTGATLGSELASGNVTIESSNGSKNGSGDINVDDVVNWNTNTLTLTAADNVNINKVMTASGTAGLALNAATANGSAGAVAGGVVNAMPGSGRVDFTGSGNSLSINGHGYTLLSSASALQGIGDTGYYAVATDLDAGGISNFSPIGQDIFHGTLEGLGHTISNLNIDSTAGVAGLFAFMSGEVSNLGLVDGHVMVGASTSGVGELAGVNEGVIRNVYATGTVTASGDDASVGGLVGINESSILNAYAAVAVTGSGARAMVGGLVGIDDGFHSDNSAPIVNAYATGTVTASSTGSAGGLVGFIQSGQIQNTYATGAVSGASGRGGLVGGGSGTVVDSYWDTQTTGQSTSAGGVGETTAQLQANLPSGFSTSTWALVPGKSYPYLLQQFMPGVTPVAVSGTVFTDAGTTRAGAGVAVNAQSGGSALGTTATYANGYFYYLLDPSTLVGGNLLVYAKNYGSGGATNGAAFADGYGTLPVLGIFGNAFHVQTGATQWSTVLTDLAGAEGSGATAATALAHLPASGLANLVLGGQGAFNFDSALDWIAGNLDVTAGGNLTQSARLNVAGTSSLDAGSHAITLTNVGNDFQGAVALTGGATQIADANTLMLGTLDTGALTAISGGALNLGQGLVNGGLNVMANGGISQAGALTVNGVSTFTQDSSVAGLSQDIDLGNYANAFNGNVNFIAGPGAQIRNLSLQDTSATPGMLTLPASITGNLTLDLARALVMSDVAVDGALDVTAAGGIALDGDMSSGGMQTWHSAVTLAGDTTLTSMGNGAIDLIASVDGAHALTVNTGGATSFGGAVGANTALASLTTDAGGSTTLAGNVTTSGSQIYGDAVNLSGSTVLSSSGNGAIGFGSTVDGPYSLGVSTGGAATFSGAVGSLKPLLGLTVGSGTFSAQALNIQGLLSVSAASGGISQGGAFTVGGGASFSAGNGSIALDNGGNSFGGTVSLSNSGANNVSLSNASALTLGNVSVGSGTLTLAGAGIDQSAGSAITQANGAGAVTLDGGSGAVALGNSGNDFTGTVSAAGSGVSLADNGALAVGNIQAGSGTVTLVAGGNLGEAAGGVISTSGNLTGSSGGNTDLAGANRVGSLGSFSSGGDFSFNDAQSLLVTAAPRANGGAGDVTLSTTGTGNSLTLAAGLTGNTVTLDSDSDIVQTGGTIHANALAVDGGSFGAGALNIGAGGLDVRTSGGAISQSGAFSVAGTSSFDAGAGDITLSNAANDFGGTVTATGNNVTLRDVNALTAVLAAGSGNLAAGGALTVSGSTGGNLTTSASTMSFGATTVGGSLSAAGSGAITQTGALVITGTSLLSSSNAIVLDDSGNDFAGTVTAFGSNVTLRDVNALTAVVTATGSGDLTAGGALTVSGSTGGNLTTHAGATSFGATTVGTVGGNLSATADGTITQTGALDVTGTTVLDAGTHAITLSNAGNDFNGSVSATGSGVSLHDANDLTIASLTDNGGAVNLVAGGTLSLPAGDIDTGNDDLMLVSNGGSLVTPGALDGGNVSLSGRDGVTLNDDVTANGTLHLASSDGSILQVAGIVTAGTLTGSSSGATTLTGANAIGTLGSFAAAGFSLIDTPALTVIGPVDGGSGTTLTTGGGLTIDGAVSGTTTTLMSGGAISEGIGGAITAGTLTGNSVGSTTLTGANAIGTLGSFAAAAFSLIDTQALTVSGPVDGGGGTTLTTTAGDLTLDGNVSGTTTTLKSAGAIVLQGDLDASSLTLNAVGTISDASAINVDLFDLQSGNWVQDGATLPAFGATDFRLDGGSFLRVAGGTGSSADPYQVADVYGLQGMASTALLADSFALANAIDASGTANWNSGMGFVPIGGTLSSAAFSGSFDGQSYAISGLTINRPTTNYVGLFGYDTGTIRDLGLEGGSVTGSYYVGGLVGFNGGSISEAYATGSVTGNYVGGLVGFNEGSISEAYSTGSVTGTDGSGVGGLVGYNYGSISEAYATGSVTGTDGSGVGGLVGVNTGSISEAYATGSVTGTDDSDVGGLVGYNYGSISASFYATTDADGDAINSGLGLVGVSYDGGTVDSYSSGKTWAELTTLSTFIDAGWDDISNVGGDGSVWRIYEGSTTPLLRSFLTRITVTADSGGGKTYDGTTDAGDVGYTPSITGAALDGTASYTLDSKNAGTRTVSVDGLYSDQQGYDIVYAGGSYTVDKATLTLSAGTDSKVYDGTTTSAGTVGVVGLQTGDSLDALTQSFASKNVLGADASTLQVDAGYSLDDGNGGANYTVVTNAATGTITPKAISGDITAIDKTYDGTTRATTSGTLIGVVPDDVVAFDTHGAFEDRNAGSGKTVDVSGSLSGTDANNYTLGTNATTTADIAQAALTVSTDNVSKTYDGTTSAAGTLVVTGGQLYASDTISGGTFAFTDADAGTGKTVTVSGATVGDGNSGGNYAVSYVDNSAGTITPKALTASLTGTIGKTYDGTTAATLAAADYALDGFVGGQGATVTQASGTYDSANVADATTVTATLGSGDFSADSGTNLSNYALPTSASGAGSIAQATLVVTANDAGKTYDGLAYNGGNGVTYSGFVNGETASVLGGTLAYGGTAQGATNAGSYALTPGGLISSNYAITEVGGSLTIDKALATVIANSGEVTYNGQSQSVTGFTASGLVNGETTSVLTGLSDVDGVGTNAGSYTHAISGSDGNYDLSFVAGSLTIDKAALTVSSGNVGKVYDGTTSANGSAIVTGGQLFGSDGLSGGTFAFTDKNAGTDKTVTVSGVTVDDGNGGGNYTVSYADNTASTITPKAISGVITASNKTYDGTMAATTSGALTGVIAGDSVTFASSGSFTDKNAGTGKTVDVSGSLDGADAGNYTLSNNATTTADIDKAQATVTANSGETTYDGQSQSIAGFTASGLVNGETASVLAGLSDVGGVGTNAGSYTHAISGSDGNYDLSFVEGELLIDKAQLTVTANDAGKAWDGVAYSGGNGVTYNGFVGGETVGVLGGALAYGGSSQGAVDAGDYAISASGYTSGNYAIGYVDGTLTIAPTPQGWLDVVDSLQSSPAALPVPGDSPQVLEIIDGGVNLGVVERAPAPALARTPK